MGPFLPIEWAGAYLVVANPPRVGVAWKLEELEATTDDPETVESDREVYDKGWRWCVCFSAREPSGEKAERLDGLAFPGEPLPAVLLQHHWIETSARGPKSAAGLDRRQLTRIACEHELATASPTRSSSFSRSRVPSVPASSAMSTGPAGELEQKAGLRATSVADLLPTQHRPLLVGEEHLIGAIFAGLDIENS